MIVSFQEGYKAKAFYSKLQRCMFYLRTINHLRQLLLNILERLFLHIFDRGIPTLYLRQVQSLHLLCKKYGSILCLLCYASTMVHPLHLIALIGLSYLLFLDEVPLNLLLIPFLKIFLEFG
jgi:hypothetical protein